MDQFDRTSYFDDTVVAQALLDCIRRRKSLIGVGSIKAPADVERAFAIGFDHVAMGTTLLINPDWRTSRSLNMQLTEHILPPDIPPAMRQMLLRFFA
jgi:2,4-dienoyl-CoA reductase-like NADH-dependent reductase (Old Yellow Enzyme family)